MYADHAASCVKLWNTMRPKCSVLARQRVVRRAVELQISRICSNGVGTITRLCAWSKLTKCVFSELFVVVVSPWHHSNKTRHWRPLVLVTDRRKLTTEVGFFFYCMLWKCLIQFSQIFKKCFQFQNCFYPKDLAEQSVEWKTSLTICVYDQTYLDFKLGLMYFM